MEDRGGRRPVRRLGTAAALGSLRRLRRRLRRRRRRCVRAAAGGTAGGALRLRARHPALGAAGVRGAGPGGRARAGTRAVALGPEPRSVSIEDDIPEDDDPDLDESALSGQELLIRELGATVVEEIANE